MNSANEQIIRSSANLTQWGNIHTLVYALYLTGINEIDFHIEEEKIKETFSKLFLDSDRKYVDIYIKEITNDFLNFKSFFGIDDIDKKITEIFIIVSKIIEGVKVEQVEQMEHKFKDILKGLGIKEEDELTNYLNDLVMKYIRINKD